ncbi:Uncharacterised protein [Candidatus Anstonella stagnisolia]|nr:Uncharacterised protein [Candidatus Anstonella stagnisolia]
MRSMNSLAVLLSFAILFALLFGCTMPWEQPAPTQPTEQPAQNTTQVENQSSTPVVNETVANETQEPGIDWGEVAGNETQGQLPVENVTQENNVTLPQENGTNATENGTIDLKTPFSRPKDSHDIANGTFGLVQTPDAALNVYFIDVGFGNSVLVNKGTFNMLIDAGPASQGGKVASFVSAHGISGLDVVVATHDDVNSIGGIPTVLASIPTQEVWTNNVSSNSTQYNALMNAINSQERPVKYPVAKQTLFVNGLNISIMNPQKDKLRGSSESDAIIMRLEYGDFCIVLLDPTVHEIEPALLSSGVPVGKCQVVQYFNRGEGRGGMEGYSTLVEGNMNSLKDVVISVGPSQYDLPSPTTLDRFEIHGWNVYRTDTGGTITVSSDGKNYTISKEK